MFDDEVFTFDIFITKCLHGEIKNGLLNKTRIMDYDELKEMLDDIVLPNNSSLFNLIIG